MARGYLDIATIDAAIPAMRERGVSEVARGPGGFISQYKRAGSAAKLSEEWKKKREAFLDRHLKQMEGDENQGWEKVKDEWRPTRRHLALVAWGYSPTPGRLRAWLKRWKEDKLMGSRIKKEK